MKTRTKVLSGLLNGISPEVAFALGKAQRYMDADEACARLLLAEGLVDSLQGQTYAHLNRLAEILSEAFDDAILAAHPEAPEPEPMPAPEQPAAPTFTPAPELPAPPVLKLSACDGCSKPGISGLCADCKPLAIDVKPPGIEF